MHLIQKKDTKSSNQQGKTQWLVIVAVLAVLIAVGGFLLYRQLSKSDAYIYRKDNGLYLKQQPYRFNGLIAPTLFDCKSQPDLTISTDARQQYFASLPPGSVTKIMYYDDTQAERLAMIVAEARRYGQRLMISLASDSAACDMPAKDDQWYANGYKAEYLNHVRQIAQLYDDEPTIAMWEPIAQADPANPAITDFMKEVTELLRDLAPKQLVVAGLKAPDAKAESIYKDIAKLDGVDIVAFTDSTDDAAISPDFARAQNLTKDSNKPLVVDWRLSAGTQPDCRTYDQRQVDAIAKMDIYFGKQEVVGLLYNFITSNDPSPCSTAINFDSIDESLSYLIGSYQIPGIPVVELSAVESSTPESQLPPTPQKLRPLMITSDAVSIAWELGRDTTADIAGYNIFRNGVINSTSVLSSYADIDLRADTNYTYKISAYDQAGSVGGESMLLQLTTTAPRSTGDSDARRATAQPFAVAAAGQRTPIVLAAHDQPRVSESIQIGSPTTQDSDIVKAELLVNKRTRLTAQQAPFALMLNTRTLTNDTHEVTYKIQRADGSALTSTRWLTTANDLNLFERVRNAALEPLAGSSGVFLNSIFISLAALILLLPLAIVVAFAKLHSVDEHIAQYDARGGDRWDGF